MSTWQKNFVDYRAVPKVTMGGRRYDSGFEATIAMLLQDMEAKGEIQFLQYQKYVYLTRARIGMIPDFTAFDTKLQEQVWYEAKGMESEPWLIKKKLWTVYGPGRLRIYYGGKKKWRMVEIFPTG